MSARPSPLTKQTGVAIITALLIISLAVSVISTLFWQQGILFKRVFSLRDRIQIEWIERAAIDWVRAIINLEKNQQVTHLGQIWAVPVAETSLEDFLEKNKLEDRELEKQKAVLSGGLSDAQGLYNLRRLILLSSMNKAYAINPFEITRLKKLLQLINISESIADTLSVQMLGKFNSTLKINQAGNVVLQDATPQRLEDFFPIDGLSAIDLARLKKFVFYFPIETAINVNTAPLEVLAAYIPEIDITVLRAVFADRKRIYAVSRANFFVLTGRPELSNLYADSQLNVRSNLFFLEAAVELNSSRRRLTALLNNGGNPNLGSNGNNQVEWQFSRN